MKLLDKIIAKKKYIVLFMLVIAFISSFTLFIIPNMSRGHDLAFHLSRISAIKDNLKIGIIGGYIYPNYLNGYGYGNGLFYPDIFLYIPALLSYLGISVITSYKIFLFLISFATIATMYISVKGITKDKKCALVSSFVYGFSVYRLIDMFTRAALGETLAFIFAPLVIYGIYEIIYRDYKKFYILALGMTGLLLSHLISTYLIGITLVVLCLINIKKFLNEKKRILYLILAAVLTLGLTAYFIFPMLEQMLSGKFYFNNLDQTSKLLERTMPIWGIILEIPNYVLTKLWIPTGIGIGFIVIIYYYFKQYKKENNFINFCFIFGIVTLICTTKIFPWNLFKVVMSPIQFPWRLYFVATLLLSIGVGILLNNKKKYLNKKVNLLFILFLVPVLVVGGINFTEQNIKEVGEYDVSFGEYMPIESSKENIYSRDDIIASNDLINYKLDKENINLKIEFNNNLEKTTLELPILYYKGYEALINDKPTNLYKTNNGLVGIDVVDEEGIISVSYKGTKIQVASRIISSISLVLLGYLIIKKRDDLNEK